ncbi:MAG: EAL domain-containing protein, partial [Zoogloeaceae bacterium]|nr:EAL domain-containing protein [Zoogloeaceae bacterium]
IAEGVETAEQRDCLAVQGCKAYQGYYFGRPVPADQLCLVPKILSPASPKPGMM